MGDGVEGSYQAEEGGAPPGKLDVRVRVGVTGRVRVGVRGSGLTLASSSGSAFLGAAPRRGPALAAASASALAFSRAIALEG